MPAGRASPLYAREGHTGSGFLLLAQFRWVLGFSLGSCCVNIMTAAHHLATWTSPLYARKRADYSVADGVAAKSTNYTSWNFVVPRKFCFAGPAASLLFILAVSRVHCMRAMGYLLLRYRCTQ